MATKKVLLLAGDGIGTEIMLEAKKILAWLEKRRGITFELTEDHVGGASIDAYGEPLTEDVLAQARAADAVLFGAIGDPKFDTPDFFDKRPELAILGLRKGLDLFCNLRVAKVFDVLAGSSSLKENVVKGLDILFVRESVSGIYFGTPRDTIDLPDGDRKAYDTMVYHRSEVERVANVAFQIAESRSKKLCSVDKANVLQVGQLWRKIVTEKSGTHPTVETSHMYVDNAAMQLVRNPKQFDVILTGNMFGDILSDLSSQLTGSLGLLPSATLNETGFGLYEPVHGSAPDIAGQGKANPIAMILSVAMMLKYTFKMDAEADLIEAAVNQALESGVRTPDICTLGTQEVSTAGMGDAIVAALDELG
ncbi:MAG: 3-isopropylmalate dehydrogenase [Alphaproteobacteria bacterium]